MAHGVVSHSTMKHLLLSWIGHPTFTLIKNLSPEGGLDILTYNEMCERLLCHFAQSINVICGRKEFGSNSQLLVELKG